MCNVDGTNKVIDRVGSDIYIGTNDGVKAGIIDKMFLDDDGGAIQYITPFSAEQMVDLGILKRLK